MTPIATRARSSGAIDEGVTLPDTADMYGNESLVGRAIGSRREGVRLCSKFGVIWGEGGDWRIRADRAYVQEACEASLRRLGVDVIDVYYLQRGRDAWLDLQRVLATGTDRSAERGKRPQRS